MSISKRIELLVDKFCKGNKSFFANKIGTSEANMRNYISGTEPKYSILYKIVKIFEVNPTWLITGKGEMLLNEEGKEEKETVVGMSVGEHSVGWAEIDEETHNYIVNEYLERTKMFESYQRQKHELRVAFKKESYLNKTNRNYINEFMERTDTTVVDLNNIFGYPIEQIEDFINGRIEITDIFLDKIKGFDTAIQNSNEWMEYEAARLNNQVYTAEDIISLSEKEVEEILDEDVFFEKGGWDAIQSRLKSIEEKSLLISKNEEKDKIIQKLRAENLQNKLFIKMIFNSIVYKSLLLNSQNHNLKIRLDELRRFLGTKLNQ